MQDRRILVIDDEVEALEVMVELLKREGHSPRFTADSREASALLETTPFDVIVSDVMMPHLNGLQLLEKAKRRNPEVQVVLVTAYASRELAIAGLEKGASGFIEKPFQADSFLTTVRQALWRQRLKQDPTASA